MSRRRRDFVKNFLYNQPTILYGAPMNLKFFALATAIALPATLHADWQPYVGLGVGGENLSVNSTLANTPLFSLTAPQQYTIGSSTYNASITHPMYNINLGIGNVFPNHLYLATELNANYFDGNIQTTGLTQTFPITNSPPYVFSNVLTAYMRWTFELDQLIGYQLSNGLIPYAKVGLITGSLTTDYIQNVTPDFVPPYGVPNVDMKTHQQLWGGVIGLGVRYPLSQHWQVGIEADYAKMANVTETNYGYWQGWYDTGTNQPFTFSYHPEMFYGKFTLDYVF